MKKNNYTGKVRSIDQFEFQIIPISISFSRKNSKMFYIYFEKGAQVLGKIEELIKGQVIRHNFDSIHSKSFKIASQRNLSYQWSLYLYSQQEQEEYLQSCSFNIKQQYELYIQELQRVQSDLYRIFKQKEKKIEIEQIWNDLRHDLTKNQFQISCSFLRNLLNINFKIKIYCDLDSQHQKWKENQNKKKIAKSLSSSRKISIDTKNIPDLSQSFQSKQKKSQSHHLQITSSQSFSLNPIKPDLKDHQQQNYKKQNLIESQIRITNPDGVDLTEYVQQNINYQRNNLKNDFYARKKSSILSDIIEQSNQGSSHVFTKSIQGEKLMYLDQIHQEEETPLYSPLVKTQFYDSIPDQDNLLNIKRTSTLVQKASQQFDLQQTPKATDQKSGSSLSSYFFISPSSGHQSYTKSPSNFQISKDQHKCNSPKIMEEKTETIEDFSEAKNRAIKNLIKISIIVILLILAINNLNVFMQKENKSTRKKISKNHYEMQQDNSMIEKIQRKGNHNQNKKKEMDRFKNGVKQITQ